MKIKQRRKIMEIKIVHLDPKAIEYELGYKMKTTYFDDFSVAEIFGEDAIKSTFKSAFRVNKDDYKILTELVMILNWKMDEHFVKGDDDLTALYIKLYDWLDRWCCDNFDRKQLYYYYKTTD